MRFSLTRLSCGKSGIAPLASSKSPEASSCLIAFAMHCSWPQSENTHSRSPSLPGSYVVSQINSTMTPSDSLPNSLRFRLCLILRIFSMPFGKGLTGSPQLTRPLSRHAIPDTPEEPRATSVLIPEIMASPLKYRVALLNLTFTRLHLGSRVLRPAGSHRLLSRLCRAA